MAIMKYKLDYLDDSSYTIRIEWLIGTMLTIKFTNQRQRHVHKQSIWWMAPHSFKAQTPNARTKKTLQQSKHEMSKKYIAKWLLASLNVSDIKTKTSEKVLCWNGNALNVFVYFYSLKFGVSVPLKNVDAENKWFWTAGSYRNRKLFNGSSSEK